MKPNSPSSGLTPWTNTISTYAAFSVISGGSDNVASGYWSAVGGGYNNTAGGVESTIAGGAANECDGYGAAILGGVANNIGMNANYSAVGGGFGNSIQTNAALSTIGGGVNNTAGGLYATISGGQNNTAGGQYATVAGGANNSATGNSSFAAGNNAHANYDNSFVWGDGTRLISSAGADTFAALATGGVYFYTYANPSVGHFGAFLGSNSTSWATVSDKNAKKNFQPADSISILDKLANIPIQQWNYKWEQDSDVPNIGPMAQDFKHAFYPGRDDKSITTLEFDGVELAAIQGLNQKLQEKDAQIHSLESRLNDLEQLVHHLTQTK